MLSAVPRQSQYRWLYETVLTGQVELAVTTEILLEYEEQLSIFYAPDYAGYILSTLVNLPNVMHINPLHFNWLLINNDPDDNKFVDTAIASNADYIVTNDRHFNLLKRIEFPSVAIVKLADFQPIVTSFLTGSASSD